MSRTSNIESDKSQNGGLEDYNYISDGIFPHFTTPSIKNKLRVEHNLNLVLRIWSQKNWSQKIWSQKNGPKGFAPKKFAPQKLVVKKLVPKKLVPKKIFPKVLVPKKLVLFDCC